MPRGAPSPKISITIAPDIHAQLVAAAEADDLTVSAWISNAVEHRLAIAAGLAAVAEWEAENGAFTNEELAAANVRVSAHLAAAESSSRQ